MISTEYRQYVIQYSELSDEWYALRKGGNSTDFVVQGCKTLTEIKEKLDKEAKKEQNFQRFVGYIRGGYGSVDFEKVEVTSVNEQGEAWVVKASNGRREKVRAHNIIIHNPANEERLALWVQLQMEIDSLKKKQESIVNVLEKYTPPDTISS